MPLLVGGAIYLGFRTPDLLMFHAADRAGLGGVVGLYRAAVHPLRPALPAWAVFSLPNALWTLSLVSFFGLLWRGQERAAVAWMGAAGVLAVAPEFLQAAGLLPGTFSRGDLVAGLLACGAAMAALQSLSHLASRTRS